MKNSLLFLFFLLQLNNIHGQEFLAAAQEKNNEIVYMTDLWGYIDTKGNWVIKPNFDEANFFSEGFASVKLKGMFGYIDRKENWLVEPKYAKAREFRGGYALVMDRDERWGIIDSSGKEVIGCKNGFVDYFSDGLARVKLSGWRFVRKNGTLLNTVDFTRCESFREGLAKVEIDNKWGYIDTSGTLVIKAVFNVAGNFCDGLAFAEIKGKIGFIDTKGNFKIEPKFSNAKDFSNGQARVFKDGHWLFIDTIGKEIITLKKQVDFVSKYNEGFARVHVFNNDGYVNSKGEYVGKHKYVVCRDYKFGLATARKRGKFSLLDTTGALVTKNKYSALVVCDNGMIKASYKGKYGFLDTKGTWVINPQFTDVGVFVDANKKHSVLKGDHNLYDTHLRSDQNYYK